MVVAAVNGNIFCWDHAVDIICFVAILTTVLDLLLGDGAGGGIGRRLASGAGDRGSWKFESSLGTKTRGSSP